LNRTRVAFATICLGLLAAACSGGGSSASPSAAEPTTQPTAVGSSGLALPSLPSSAKDLEALIPDEIGGITLQKFSMQGDEFVSSGGATEETQQFLEGLGVATDDVAVAAGFGSSTDTGAIVVFVFRADGAGTDRLLTVFKEALDSDRDQPLEWEAASVGGKQVERASDAEQEGMVYLYAQGDVLFYLAANREENAAEALEALP
jgi:ABC-type glycerol-3-phosphate transport system substrate-binding protein